MFLSALWSLHFLLKKEMSYGFCNYSFIKKIKSKMFCLLKTYKMPIDNTDDNTIDRSCCHYLKSICKQ